MTTVQQDSEDLTTHMLTFKARAISGNNEATVARFAIKDANHRALYPMVWNVVRALEGFSFIVYMYVF